MVFSQDFTVYQRVHPLSILYVNKSTGCSLLFADNAIVECSKLCCVNQCCFGRYLRVYTGINMVAVLPVDHDGLLPLNDLLIY